MDSVDSTCFCDDDEDEEEEEEEAVSSSSSTCGRSACCCCHYDPFEDDESPESKIQDLSFALKKLAVMKCQMKKWRLERLELESQARSLKQALQSYGVEPNAILKPDPVLVHLRHDNAKLQRRKEELEDEVRDLRETLADRECCEDNPCDAVAYLKEKMLAVRHRCAVEKRHMRETVASLQVRLQAAQDDGSCAALNRLRAKLRELMTSQGGEPNGVNRVKADPGASIALEKSIETMAELSRSCDELRRKNERLLGEVETLKREIKEDTTRSSEKLLSKVDLAREPGEITELSRRVKACESMASQMRLQLTERDDAINDLKNKLFAEKQNLSRLEHELGQANLGQKTLTAQIETMKAELKEKDDKITQLLREVRKSSELALDAGALEGELDRLRPAITELEAKRDELANELDRVRKELAERNAEIDKLTREHEKKRSDSEADVLERERKHSLEMENMRKELDQLRANSERLKKIEADLERSEQDNKTLKENTENASKQLREATGAADKLNVANESLQKEKGEALGRVKDLEERLKAAEVERSELISSAESERSRAKEAEAANSRLSEGNDSLQKSRDELAERTKSLEEDLRRAKGELDKAREAAEEARRELEGTAKERDECKNEGSRLRGEIEKLRAAGDSADKQTRELQARLEALSADKDRLERELGELKWQLDKLKKEQETATNVELDSLKAAQAKLLEETAKLKSDVSRLSSENAQLKADLERANAETGKAKRVSAELSRRHSQAIGDSARLAKELEIFKVENVKLKKGAGSAVVSVSVAASVATSLATPVNNKSTKNDQNLRVKDEVAEKEKSARGDKPVVKKADGGKDEEKHAEKKIKDAERTQTKGSDKGGPEKEKNNKNKESTEVEANKNGPEEVATKKQRTSVAQAEHNSDFTQASQALKTEMEMQIEAVDRMREFINYAEGKAAEKPSMITTELLASRNDAKEWSAVEINELFRTSRLLSEAILKTGKEVGELEDVLKAASADSPFDVDSWLQSLTLSELAELHDRVCLLTSSLVRKDNNNNNNGGSSNDDGCRCPGQRANDHSTERLLNARIAALQRRIAEKQRAAADRANEMHRALLVEQARLIRMSDDVNRGREINLAMRLSVDAGAIPLTSMPIDEADSCCCCCGRLDCARTGCDANPPDVWRRK